MTLDEALKVAEEACRDHARHLNEIDADYGHITEVAKAAAALARLRAFGIDGIVKYVYDYVENADCSCQDLEGTCWYHIGDSERIGMLNRAILARLEEGEGT